MKLEKTKSDTNSRLKYIKHEVPKNKSPKKATLKEQKRVRIKDERPEKLERDITNMPSTSKGCIAKQPSKEEILKIFERNERPGIPDIKILSDFGYAEPNSSCKNSQPMIPTVQENEKNKIASRQNMLLKNVLDKPSSNLALFQVSNISSRTSTTTNNGLIRVHSSPEIAQGHLLQTYRFQP